MDNNKSMINGNIAATLIIFAIPILIGNIFQQLYNVADTAVIGNFLGDKALAAVGEASPVQIVTGASNVHEGDWVPAALNGSTLPGGVKIKKGKLRGVESYGMLCSLGELGLTLHDFPYAI